MVEIRPGSGGSETPAGIPVGANPGAQSGPGTPSAQSPSSQARSQQQTAISAGAMNIEQQQSGALPSMSAPIGGGGPAVVPIGRGAPINPSPTAVAMGQGFNNAITGASMAGFNDLATGFSDVIGGFGEIGVQLSGLAHGKVIGGAQAQQAFKTTDFGFFGSGKNLMERGGQTLAYLTPGGAVLHGIGDVQEGPAARIFDVGVGVIAFVPGLGELGSGLGAGARLGLGAGAGAAIGGVGSALHGGSLTQDLESAAFGAVVGAAGAYLLPKVTGFVKGGPPEPAPPVATIGTTPEGEPIVGDVFNFPGAELHGGPAGLQGQVGPGDVFASERGGAMTFGRVTLPDSGFNLNDIEGSTPVQGRGFLESGARVVDDPLKGETYMEGPAPDQSTSALKGRPFPSYKGEPKIDFGGEGVTPKPVKMGFGYDNKGGPYTAFDTKYYQNLGNPSFDESLSGPVTPSDETMTPPRGLSLPDSHTRS